MTATKKAKKSAAQKRERKERRFTPEATYASRVTSYVGMAGALALGAGVYGQWLTDNPLKVSPYLLAAGSVAFLGSLWKGTNEIGALRVGDAGVALENEDELVRILWCDIERVSLNSGKVDVKGKHASISFPAEAHPKALAWVLSESTCTSWRRPISGLGWMGRLWGWLSSVSGGDADAGRPGAATA